MGGGQETSGAAGTNAGAMGLYDSSYNYGGSSFDFTQLGKGLQQAGQTYQGNMEKEWGQSDASQNYRSGSGSPYIGAGQTMSADQPIAPIPLPTSNQSVDQQKIIYDLYQKLQQRLQNSGQFSM